MSVKRATIILMIPKYFDFDTNQIIPEVKVAAIDNAHESIAVIVLNDKYIETR